MCIHYQKKLLFKILKLRSLLRKIKKYIKKGKNNFKSINVYLKLISNFSLTLDFVYKIFQIVLIKIKHPLKNKTLLLRKYKHSN
jgi:hypothetical protein